MTRRLQKCAIACAAAYAIALQGFFFALVIGNPAFAGLNGATRAGFEFCPHAGTALKQSNAPTPDPMGNVHCMFCLAGAVFVDSAPPIPPNYHKVLLARAVTTLGVRHLIALAAVGSAWPRGPPV